MNLGGVERTFEYEAVSEFYGAATAARSKVPKINHINEGVYLLNALGASLAAKRAFCLHPLLQDDASLEQNFDRVAASCDSRAVMLALEYRNIANQYLSRRTISSLEEIALSPLAEVNHMLIADKVQNRKDFELYHLGSHPRSGELHQYFKNWLARLGVSEEAYQRYKQELQRLS